MLPFCYNKVLVIGATSGIGQALAEKFLLEGIEVVVTGRREERLKAFTEEKGGSYEVFDISKLDEIPRFVEKVMTEHTDIDAVVFNSGIQRGFNFTKPETVDLELINQEFTVNYLAYVHLTTALLPYLLKRGGTALIYVSSTLGMVPMARCPNYCASKAALHQFVLSLRNQMKGTRVEVLEIMPPAVQTELHDANNQPDLGGKMGMPLDEFIQETWKDLEYGNEYNEFPIGFGKVVYSAIEPSRRGFMEKFPQVPANIQ